MVESDEDDTEPISRGRKSIRRAALTADEGEDGESESSSNELGEVVGLAGEDGGDEVCLLCLFLSSLSKTSFNGHVLLAFSGPSAA
jgi:hypothetical protein